MAFLCVILGMASYKLNKAQKRKFGFFLGSLGLAILFWLIYSLSNRYVYPAVLYVKWTNVPLELKTDYTSYDTLEAQIEGSGWHLLFKQFDTETRQLNISLNTLNGKNYLVLKPLLKKLSEQLPEGQKLLAIKPDSVFFDRNKLISKRVPVKLKYQLKFEQFYGLSNAIRLEPAFVKLKGTAASLQNIAFVQTEILKQQNINSSFESMIAIHQPENATYRSVPEFIKVTIPVGQYTEKVLELDLLVKNKPALQKLSLYPAQVKLTISTALDNYPSIGPDDFEAFVDLNNWQEKNQQRLPIKFGRIPNFIKIVKIEPQTVDFIIYP